MDILSSGESNWKQLKLFYQVDTSIESEKKRSKNSCWFDFHLPSKSTLQLRERSEIFLYYIYFRFTSFLIFFIAHRCNMLHARSQLVSFQNTIWVLLADFVYRLLWLRKRLFLSHAHWGRKVGVLPDPCSSDNWNCACCLSLNRWMLFSFLLHTSNSWQDLNYQRFFFFCWIR